MMGFLSRIFRPSTERSVEGQYREGPWYLPITGGWLSREAGQIANWWQHGHNVAGTGTTAMVEACVSSYSQTIAMCSGDHWLLDPETGGRTRQTTSALYRILKRPNSYQSQSDFLLNLTRSLYLDGNAYALGLRNSRFEIDSLHLMDPNLSRPRIADDGSIFYELAGNPIIEKQFKGGVLVPARDVLHVRMHTPRHPLIGETPLQAAAYDMMVAGAMSRQQFAFYSNQARPSYVLSTDQVLSKEQMDDLRERWREQSNGMNAGGTPIMAAGLKPVPIQNSASESQLADIMKLTDQHVAMVFRIPLQVLGIGGTPFASTEALMQSWVATGLGFTVNHIETAFDRMFNLKGVPDEYVEFDTESLLRSAFKDRIAGLAQAVQAGIFSPNEARNKEGYARVKYGEEPRVQQQVVPLSYWGQSHSAPPPPVGLLPPPVGLLPPPAEETPEPETIEGEAEKEAAYDWTVNEILARIDDANTSLH